MCVFHLLFSKISDLVCFFSPGRRGGRELGVGSFWVFGFFLGSVVRRNLGTGNIVRISVSMIKLFITAENLMHLLFCAFLFR